MGQAGHMRWSVVNHGHEDQADTTCAPPPVGRRAGLLVTGGDGCMRMRAWGSPSKHVRGLLLRLAKCSSSPPLLNTPNGQAGRRCTLLCMDFHGNALPARVHTITLRHHRRRSGGGEAL
jgi:hypothetical protein